jgi:hypothetical protein
MTRRIVWTIRVHGGAVSASSRFALARRLLFGACMMNRKILSSASRLALATAIFAPLGCALSEPDESIVDDEALVEGADDSVANEDDLEVSAESNDQLGFLALVNGLELITKSAGGSDWWRSPNAYCPGSKTLVGMGSNQTFNGHVLFRGLVPIQGNAANPIGAQAAAHEDLTGTTSNWELTTYATCSSLLSGLEVAHTGTSSSSSATRTHTVSCPAGKRVIGAGGTIWYGNGRVKIDEIRPNESLEQVTVYASEDQDGTSANWSLRAYAVCAYAPTGLVRVRAAAANGWDRRAVTATCPAEKRLLSVAGGVESSNPTPMRVYQMMPSLDLKTATVRVGTHGSTSGATGEVRAYAICADG